jgi:hypothetical protein
VESGLGRVFWLEVIGSLGFCVDTRVYCPALASLGGSLQNIFPHQTLFHLICPHRLVSWVGSHAMPGRLSLNKCLWSLLASAVHTVELLRTECIEIFCLNCHLTNFFLYRIMTTENKDEASASTSSAGMYKVLTFHHS